MMDCREVGELLSEYGAGRLAPGERAEMAVHLEGCTACRRLATVEAELNAALDRLPLHAAPEPLKRKLEALVAATVPPPSPIAVDATASRAAASASAPAPAMPLRTGPIRRRASWVAPVLSAFGAAALVLVVVRATPPRPGPVGDETAALISEAVNDHLRVVASTHPVEIESGGIHQVKPWFTGRLDFAPRVAFSGDEDFPLVGGSVGYFRDRKAAVFVFKRHLHTVTLLVFPPERLEWPASGLARVGRLSIAKEASRGFSILLWQDGGLGYALVSDVNAGDLELLASRINPG